MKRVFAEMGIGNETFFSTEIEEGDQEERVPKLLLPQRVTGYYLRLWVGKTVIVLSTNEGWKTKKKDRNAFKLLLGVSGDSV
jgi:hypothetical protein